MIRDAIADGKFSINEAGCLKPETQKKLVPMSHITVLVGDKRSKYCFLMELFIL